MEQTHPSLDGVPRLVNNVNAQSCLFSVQFSILFFFSIDMQEINKMEQTKI